MDDFSVSLKFLNVWPQETINLTMWAHVSHMLKIKSAAPGCDKNHFNQRFKLEMRMENKSPILVTEYLN